jgi:glucosylceramidase
MKESGMNVSILVGLSVVGVLFCPFSSSLYARENGFKTAKIYMTAEDTSNRPTSLGFRASEPLDQPDENYPTIMIDLDKTLQTIEGFWGCAFTDAAAIRFDKMSREKQEEFLTACFDPEKGNGYTLCRTTIHSCDYSDEPYTSDDLPGDKHLEHFTIDHDRKYRIDFIQRAMKAARGNLKIFASP